MRILFMKYLIFFSGFWTVWCDDIGYFWHITDTHVDQNYSRTGNVQNLCHEDLNSLQSKANSILDNGLYGNFLCDSPQYLINATILSMKQIHPTPDFIIWTGDNLPHTEKFDPGWDITFEAIRNTTLLLSSTFPNVLILPSIGNHDSFPPNILPADNTSNNIYKGYLEKGRWKDLINESEWSTFVKGGYYSHLVKPGLRIISLNTILWYEPNNLTAKISDPANQFQWLEGILKNSSKLSEKVYIIGHVPPGFYNRGFPGQKCGPTFHLPHLESYLKILLNYSQVIVGQLYGHLHVDMFQVYQYNTGVFKGSSLLASSVTPWHSNKQDNVSIPVNPSVRLIHYSRTDARLLEFDQYYLNLTKANNMSETPKENTNVYELLYSFAKFYGVPDLSTESLVQVYETLKRNKTVFDSFFTFLSAAERTVDCDSDCEVAQLCSISCSSNQEYDMCFKSSDYNYSTTPIPPHKSKESVIIYVSICLVTFGFILLLFIVIKKFWISSGRSEYSQFSSI
ncbi:acid sphingomyelinase-like phosphodiesterase 3b [Argiope bruennichi]|uniref:acid sphingomyelinase-like phosphodiesterase 3b n=1 Tax=Argiope bruennichi TaxID=94029 RepID=UPI0024953720|nr:acid sphingomyelinase-like phosphodiesterase 3b [Argiope bruennichi]